MSLTYDIAQRRVHDFVEEELAKQPAASAEPLDCEAYLQLGIDAYRWLIQADIEVRKEVFCGGTQFDPDVDRLLRDLFARWLDSAGTAEQLVSAQSKSGRELRNLAEFKKCVDEVRAIVTAQNEDELPVVMARLQDQAIIEFQNGETSECLSGE